MLLDDELLYKNCICISSFENDIYVYSPINKLDEELFKLLTNNKLLKTQKKIIISNKINKIEFYAGFYVVGNIKVDDSDNPKCNVCNLSLPFDIKYYNKNDINICYLCYDNNHINTNDFIIIHLESNLDNIRDWVSIFTFKKPGFYYYFYCNLNANSKYYTKFAMSCYTEMLGVTFNIIKETCIEDIINKYYE